MCSGASYGPHGRTSDEYGCPRRESNDHVPCCGPSSPPSLPPSPGEHTALSYRAAWLGMELGPGWHWPPERPVVVPASTAMAAAGGARPTVVEPAAAGDLVPAVAAVAPPTTVDDEQLEEQQAEAMAELIGSLASYVDVVGQVRCRTVHGAPVRYPVCTVVRGGVSTAAGV